VGSERSVEQTHEPMQALNRFAILWENRFPEHARQ